MVKAGVSDTAAEDRPLTALQAARVELLRAQLAFVANHGSEAPVLLLNAARRPEPIDAGLSRRTYLEALSAAMFAARLAAPGAGVQEVARAAAAAPRPPDEPHALDLVLDGLAALFAEGYEAGTPILRRALAAFGSDASADEDLRLLFLACIVAFDLRDDERWDQLSARAVQLGRAAGALTELPLAWNARGLMLLFTGDLTAAMSLAGEIQTVTDAMGSDIAPYTALALAAFRGRQAEATALIEVITREVMLRGVGSVIAIVGWS